MGVDASWQEWKRWLASAVAAGRAAGLNQRDLMANAERIGDFLARHVDPANPQQRVLQELWSVADQGEQRAIASALVKLVSRADEQETQGGRDAGGYRLT